MIAVWILAGIAAVGWIGFCIAVLTVRRIRDEVDALSMILVGGVAGWVGALFTVASLVTWLVVWLVSL